MVELLLDAGADPNAALPGGETALMTAARTGRVDAVRALIARGADVNATEGRRGQTALMWAAAEGHVETVEGAASRRARISATPLDSGFTPLLFAVREGQIDVVRALLEGGRRRQRNRQGAAARGRGRCRADARWTRLERAAGGGLERALRAGGANC